MEKEKLVGEKWEPRVYVAGDQVKHVTYSQGKYKEVYVCGVCGHLPVIDGVVVHTKPDEMHG